MWKLWRARAGLPAALLFLGPAVAQQPSYLYGRVMMEGGAPPGALVAIESACNVISRIEGYADSQGRFRLRLDDKNDSAQDASAWDGMARVSPSGLSIAQQSIGRRLDGCELRAKLPGYESETVRLAGRISDESDLGVIILHRLGPAEGLRVSMTSLAAPKDAQKALQKGRQALAKGKREDARKSLEKATRLYPGYAEAWFELGSLQVVQNDPPFARASFEAAIRADPKFLLPYVGLAVLQGAAQEWPQVEETTARALALDPNGFPGMHFYNALAKYRQHDLAGAEKSVREAERLDKNRDIVSAWELLGVLLATRLDFAGAAEQYRTYLALAPGASNATDIRARLDRMEKLSAAAAQDTAK
jgi:tetratricopeptide (TPR) repeat protein